MRKLLWIAIVAIGFVACEKDAIVEDEIATLKSGKAEKVKIWKLNGNGNYILIEVSENALDAHLAKGAILYCEPKFEQGFEENSEGWMDADNDWHGSITQVEGAETSATGNYYAIFEGDASSAPFTRFDGYKSVWTEGGWTAEISIYLDPSWENGTGFDYSVAANGSDGNHQRDFIFHVTKDSSSDKLLVGGSNNTNFAPREDLENINNYEVVEAGWYKLQHKFYKNDGSLAVDLNLVDNTGEILFTETRHDQSDLIPEEVGGSRYGWFTFINVEGGIKVDDTKIFRGCKNPI